jgi:hypothetical protein
MICGATAVVRTCSDGGIGKVVHSILRAIAELGA